MTRWIRIVAAAVLAASGVMRLSRHSPTMTAPTTTTPTARPLTTNVRYGDGPGRSNLLDVYLPKTTRPVPVVVWIHGGGWSGGDKSPCPVTALVDHGLAVVSINYRLTDVAPFPAQLNDCKAAVRYVRSHATDYGIDPARVGVWGASAGGHLAALLGTSATDPVEAVQAVCDCFGPSDLSQMSRQVKEEQLTFSPGGAMMTALLGGPVETKPDVARAANPIAYLPGAKFVPPFLILHGDHDSVVPIGQSRILADALKSAGVATTFEVVKNGGHGDGFDRPDVVGRVVGFFRTTLGR